MRIYGTQRSRRRVSGRRWLIAISSVAALLFAIFGFDARGADHDLRHAVARTHNNAQPPAASSFTATATTTSPTTSRASHPSRSAPPGQPVPILMYHVIAAPPTGAPYPDLYLPPTLFEAQVRYLHDHGYHAVTLDDVWRYWHHTLRLPTKPIVLSFDDGYLSQYSVAARFLARYHWPGVLNLAVIHLNEGSYGLTKGRVRKMIVNGWEVDSHTINHVDVTTLDPTQLKTEVGLSRTILRRLFDQPVDFFCYPAGAYNATAIDAVRAAGYLAATTTNEGLASPHQDPYQLDRLRISGTETAAQLATQLQSP